MLVAVLIISIISIVLSLTLLFFVLKKKDGNVSVDTKDIENATNRALNASIAEEMKKMATLIETTMKLSSEAQKEKTEEMNKQIKESLNYLREEMRHLTESTGKAITELQNNNEKKLNEIKGTVDEKLEKTLNDRISKSFETVSKQLENVYKAVGEMQKMANDVDSLQKVLSNVKTKGILGEIQLKAILEEILAPTQYEENINTRPRSSERVEFAIKLPGQNGENIYLPIDSKFPLIPYQDLLKAYDEGNKTSIEDAQKVLRTNVLKFAKDINEKYLEVPYTTDFGVMFVPIEGLYAEIIKLGLVQELQQKYKINVAGPSTMAAFLNALRMGFNTLAIQKRSSEVWNILGAVKTEFENFAGVLEKAQQRLDQTQEEIEKLVGARTKKIVSKLKSVEALPSEEASEILEIEDENN